MQGPYQAPGFVVVQVDKSSDVIFAFLVLGIHELLGFLVAELHIIPTAPPLPGGALCAWPRGGRGGGPAPCQLTATLQQLAHAAGLRDGVAHPSRRDGIHKGCFTDICRRTDRAGIWGQLQQAKHHPQLTSQGLIPPLLPLRMRSVLFPGRCTHPGAGCLEQELPLASRFEDCGTVRPCQCSSTQLWRGNKSPTSSCKSGCCPIGKREAQRAELQVTRWHPQLPHTILQYLSKQ